MEEAVTLAHRDLDRLIALLEATPALVNAAWDWGGGDFETPLGAAAHMGRRDIAEMLLGRGARLDVFAAAMLGMEPVVHHIVETFPDAVHWEGPHGISLARHARAGSQDALAEWIEELADAGHRVDR